MTFDSFTKLASVVIFVGIFVGVWIRDAPSREADAKWDAAWEVYMTEAKGNE